MTERKTTKKPSGQRRRSRDGQKQKPSTRRSPKQAPESYQTCLKLFAKLQHLEDATAILHWDNAVVMPTHGAAARAEQLATVSTLHHAIITDEEVGAMLESLQQQSKSLSSTQRANVRLMWREYQHAASIPSSLVSALTKAGAECEMVWRQARADNDFATLAPYLKTVVSHVREMAKIKSEALGVTPYEALLDRYDEGRKEESIDQIFESLQHFLPDFIPQVIEKQKSRPKTAMVKGDFAIENQEILARELMEALGFDFERGRLDESHHPFCGGYQSDIRITTRYEEENFMPALMGVLHETGHALYENGLPEKWRYQPIGRAQGMTMHESQSLLIEMQLSRSKAFLTFALPKMKKYLKSKGRNWTVDNIYRLYTKVEPSFIRVDADEVTYPAHIMLRYYIEKYLISGEMDVDDLPDAWRQGMEKFLGVVPQTDRDGCMQDIHWMDGSFGYFPTYTLGAIAAAQCFAAAKQANEGLLESISEGQFDVLKDWLQQNIHANGSIYQTDALLKKATGSTLDVEAYQAHLTSRYLNDA